MWDNRTLPNAVGVTVCTVQCIATIFDYGFINKYLCNYLAHVCYLTDNIKLVNCSLLGWLHGEGCIVHNVCAQCVVLYVGCSLPRPFLAVAKPAKSVVAHVRYEMLGAHVSVRR